MKKFVIKGGKPLRGTVTVSGAKNVALKTVVAASLTSEKVIIKNVPLISDLYIMIDIIEDLGGKVKLLGHTLTVEVRDITKTKISLESAANIRTSSLFLASLLVRKGNAVIPNPGGCRIGARPIDRTVKGLKKMGAQVSYNSKDGYFYSKVKDGALKGTTYRFEKPTHTGTETLIIAAVLAKGQTILQNCAQEPEIDELIGLLCRMGAKVKRVNNTTIRIIGVKSLHGTTFTIAPDRNEIVTFAVLSAITDGDILVKGATKTGIAEFLREFEKIGGGFEEKSQGLRFYKQRELTPLDINTSVYPGFMTDWQGPWTVLMTQAKGTSVVHETVYESRFGYVEELKKMGAHIELFNPKVKDPEIVYNFNLSDDKPENFHAARIYGPTPLHNAVVTISDLRAGATLVLCALAAKGESIIFGIEHLERGYEHFDERLRTLGAHIKSVIE